MPETQLALGSTACAPCGHSQSSRSENSLELIQNKTRFKPESCPKSSTVRSTSHWDAQGKAPMVLVWQLLALTGVSDSGALCGAGARAGAAQGLPAFQNGVRRSNQPQDLCSQSQGFLRKYPAQSSFSVVLFFFFFFLFFPPLKVMLLVFCLVFPASFPLGSSAISQTQLQHSVH